VSVDGFIAAQGIVVVNGWTLDQAKLDSYLADWRQNIASMREAGLSGNAHASEEWLGRFEEIIK